MIRYTALQVYRYKIINPFIAASHQRPDTLRLTVSLLISYYNIMSNNISLQNSR